MNDPGDVGYEDAATTRRVRLRLPDGVTFEVFAPYEEVVATMQRALKKRRMIAVDSSASGIRRHVNPLHVLYVEELL